MSRYLRQDPDDAWHHVTNHAVGNEDLFLKDRDRYEFLRRMFEGADKYDVVVVSFCLMGNHFHVFVYCASGRLPKFMHYLESVYAREFNMRHGRRGALFASEYHSELQTSEGQAMATIRYIHRNPLELGIDIRIYPWSSYLAYVDGDTSLFSPSAEIAQNLLGAAEEHRRYVESDAGSDKALMSAGVRPVYRAAPDIVDHMLMELCQVAARSTAVSVQEIVAPRTKARNDARLAVALIAYESRTGFAEEIRRFLGYRTGSALRSAVERARKRVDNDQQFRLLVAELRRGWAAAIESIAS